MYSLVMKKLKPEFGKKQWKVEPATQRDWQGIWEIFHEVVSHGDTYSYYPHTTFDEAMSLWVRGGAQGFVVKDGDMVVGTYSLRKNKAGFGDHVANAGYIVRKEYRGRGIARTMCEHSLKEAKRQKFLAMQFNFVVSTNSGAVELWKHMGFSIVGTVPKGFRHATKGLTDIHIMHRFLDDVEA
jgi:L-amino acid N-acyltransferase YncA